MNSKKQQELPCEYTHAQTPKYSTFRPNKAHSLDLQAGFWSHLFFFRAQKIYESGLILAAIETTSRGKYEKSDKFPLQRMSLECMSGRLIAAQIVIQI